MKNSEKMIAAIVILSGALMMGGCNFKNVAANTTNTASTTVNRTQSSQKNITESSGLNITEAGSYTISDKIDGMVTVDVANDEEVEIILDNATITSNTGTAIFVKQADKVTVTLADGSSNILTCTGEAETVDDEELNAVIYSKEDLIIDGSGYLEITSANGHGIKSKDDLKIKSGDVNIEAAKDGLHAKEEFVQDGGTVTIKAAEGIEATLVTINDGDITIEASDDGINASLKSEDVGTPTVTVNGGNITITMAQGDTDGIDSNGDIFINGGTVSINGQFPFDYDGTAEYNGGKILVNGEEITDISNQFGGGKGGGFGKGMQQGGFNHQNMTEPPEGFDPDSLPEDFKGGKRPERQDGQGKTR